MPVIIGPFFVGLFTGLLGAYALDEIVDEKVPAGGPPFPPVPTPPSTMSFQANEGTVKQVTAVFLPSAAEAIQVVKQKDPSVGLNWKAMAGYLPGLTESVAMFYTMIDPRVPMTPRLTIAGSLLYFISPVDIIPDVVPGLGHLDDLGALLGAWQYVAGYITEEHVAEADKWLRSQGIEPTPPFYLGIDPNKYKKKELTQKRDDQPPAPPPKF